MSVTPTAIPEQKTTPTEGPFFFEPIPADAYSDPLMSVCKDSLFWIVDSRSGGEVLAVVDRVSAGMEETQANARLFAASWELYQALKNLREYIKHGSLCPSGQEDNEAFDAVRDAADAALAKAEGR